MFQRLDVPGNIIGRVGWRNRAPGLENNLSFVVVFVYVVNCSARLGFLSGNNGFVNEVSVHAFSSKFR